MPIKEQITVYNDFMKWIPGNYVDDTTSNLEFWVIWFQFYKDKFYQENNNLSKVYYLVGVFLFEVFFLKNL